jgi:hypothetical protein
MDFYDRVKEFANKRKGMAPSEFIRSIGLNYSSYITTQKNGEYPSTDEAFIIARSLDTSIEYLFSGQDPIVLDNPDLMKDEIIKFNLRIPQGLYEKLGEEAAGNHRSINNEIVWQLENSKITPEKLIEILRETLKNHL